MNWGWVAKVVPLLRKHDNGRELEETIDGFEQLALERKVDGLLIAAAMVRAYAIPAGIVSLTVKDGFLDLSPLAERIERVAAYITEEINGKTKHTKLAEPGSGDQRPVADSIYPRASGGSGVIKVSLEKAALVGLQPSPRRYGAGDPAASSHPSSSGLSEGSKEGGA